MFKYTKRTDSPSSLFALQQSQSQCAADIGAIIEPLICKPLDVNDDLFNADNAALSAAECPSISFASVVVESNTLSDAYDDSGDDDGCVSFSSEIEAIMKAEEECVLKENGYRKIRKLRDTQQGELFEALLVEPEKKVIIKKVSKAAHVEQVSTNVDNDGMTYCIPKNVVKEALILNYLTASNKPSCNYIIQVIDFFHSDEYFYLVLEHIGDNCMNLKQFVEKAHEYIRDGRLAIKSYVKVIKFIFWQISVLMQWMHNDMSCCHLDLKLEHIMLQHVEFSTNAETNMVNIERSISIKICDLGSAELFKEEAKFKCSKQPSPLNEIQYQPPLMVQEEIYNAQKADIWALGIMLVHSLTGRALYSHLWGAGHTALNNQHLDKYLDQCNLRKYINDKLLSLVKHMLEINENKRYQTMDVLKHRCFKSYYNKYKNRIEEKSKSQRDQLLQQTEGLKHFPYYSL